MTLPCFLGIFEALLASAVFYSLICDFLAFYGKIFFYHENTKIFLDLFRAFACPVKPFFSV
jgi:hypothetical protein